jgi:predicted metal-dependent hydrolase
MTELVVRRLLIDLETPFPVRWAGGDAFRSAWFNALSMSFPVGEQFFIDSVRAGARLLPEAQREATAAEVQGFVGQEATHRRLHGLFNQHLVRQGMVNTIEPRARRRIERDAHLDPRIHVAATAATEHFTAVFADWTFAHPEVLEGCEPRLATLWQWHAAEESEHRTTAFELYQALGGSHTWRIRVYRFVTVIFLVDVLRQTLRNLWHDGALFHFGTWRSGWRLLMAPGGMLRGNVGRWREYLAEDFHPNRHATPFGHEWLREHADAYRVVGATG